MVVNKKVKLRLAGRDGNAFLLMAAFCANATKQGWTDEEILAVMDVAESGDYDKLVATLAAHCEDPLGGG